MAASLAALPAIFGAGGIGTTIIGGVLAGAGSAIMAKKQSEEEERQRIAEEQRQQATYEGAAEATRFWEDPLQMDKPMGAAAGNAYERASATSNKNLAVGTREERRMPGQQYRTQAPAKPSGFRYNRETHQIEKVQA
ncbi:MAG: hypothetical protein KDK24_09960 [Pseudooceanicola sp.]|nr:hypothetical protein [Pseudooceanicola sp.]